MKSAAWFILQDNHYISNSALLFRYTTIGILSLCFVISFFLWLRTRERLYGYFSLMMSGYFFEALSNICERFIIPFTPFVTTILSIPMSISIILFIKEYLVLRKSHPLLNKFFSLLLLLILLMTLCQIPWILIDIPASLSLYGFFTNLENIFSMTSAFSTMIAVIWLQFYKTDKKIKFLGVLFLPYSFFVVLMMIGRIFLNDSQGIGRFLLQYGDSINYLLTVCVFTSLLLYHLDQYHRILKKNNIKSFKSSEFTPRELELIPLVIQGFQNKEIAAELELSPKTVEAYLSALYRKMNVKNRTELVHILSERQIPVK